MTSPRISLQLWSLNGPLADDLDGTLARVSGLGFELVEAFGFVDRADELASALERHGLRAPTGHASLASDTENPFDLDVPAAASHEAVFAAAKKFGMTMVIDPYVDPSRWTTQGAIADTAARLNAAARAAAVHGITVGYHNHNHEIANLIDGRIALEVLADHLDPAVVLEVDLYWATAGGADVVALVERLGDRVVALHVKDGTLDPAPNLRERPTDQVPAGEGAVPLSAALDAASAAGYAIVEFDAYDGDIWDGLAKSRAFLLARGLR